MISLDADADCLATFRVLEKSDTEASEVIMDPNTPGSTTCCLSWIWAMSDLSNASTPDRLKECKLSRYLGFGLTNNRSQAVKWVYWLHAHAQKSCWYEEVILVEYEMAWTVNYFEHKKQV